MKARPGNFRTKSERASLSSVEIGVGNWERIPVVRTHVWQVLSEPAFLFFTKTLSQLGGRSPHAVSHETFGARDIEVMEQKSVRRRAIEGTNGQICRFRNHKIKTSAGSRTTNVWFRPPYAARWLPRAFVRGGLPANTPTVAAPDHYCLSNIEHHFRCL